MLIPLNAPTPAAPRYDLVKTVPVLTEPDERWIGGANLEGYVPCGIPSVVNDLCNPQSFAYLEAVGHPSFDSFTVRLGAKCTSRGIGDPVAFRQRLLAMFRAVESAAAEKELETGGSGAADNPALIDNPDVPAGVANLSPTEALAQLEAAIATGAIMGYIHASVRVATNWQRLNLLVPEGGAGATAVLRTGLGTPVVVGRGYTGARPFAADGTTPLGAGANDATHEWAYATGPIELRRAATEDAPEGDAIRSMARRTNDVYVSVARPYLLTWDSCIHAAVRIDRSL